MADPADLRSNGQGPTATHEVVNQRTGPVQLYWLDFEGRAMPYGIVQPNSTMAQTTYSTHAWRICDERSGVSLAEYLGPSAKLTLQVDGSLRVQVTDTDAESEEEEEESEEGEEEEEEETSEEEGEGEAPAGAKPA